MRMFSQNAEMVNQVITGANKEPSAVVKAFKAFSRIPKDLRECFQKARLKFEKYFNNDSLQIQKTYPEQLKLKDGTPFWKLPKRCPRAIKFDLQNPLHFAFVFEIGLLYAKMCGVEQFETQEEEKSLRQDKEKQLRLVEEALTGLKIAEFIPKGNLKRELGEEEESQAEEEKKID